MFEDELQEAYSATTVEGVHKNLLWCVGVLESWIVGCACACEEMDGRSTPGGNTPPCMPRDPRAQIDRAALVQALTNHPEYRRHPHTYTQGGAQAGEFGDLRGGGHQDGRVQGPSVGWGPSDNDNYYVYTCMNIDDLYLK